MSTKPLKQGIDKLEAEVARLRAKVEGPPAQSVPWWEKIAGTFANDPIYEEAMRLGREWRESFRPKSRKRRKQ